MFRTRTLLEDSLNILVVAAVALSALFGHVELSAIDLHIGMDGTRVSSPDGGTNQRPRILIPDPDTSD